MRWRSNVPLHYFLSYIEPFLVLNAVLEVRHGLLVAVAHEEKVRVRRQAEGFF